MIGYVEAQQAWCYTRGAARVVGVNLTEAVVDGWLSRGELAALVQVCRDCAAVARCTDFLAQTVAADLLPGYCPNKVAIEALRP
jgi:tellurite resistance protein